MEYTQQDIQDNMGLVFIVARGMSSITQCTDLLDFQDLVSEGVLGLIHALDRFDPDRGFRFSGYAVKCIRGYMLRGHRTLFKEHWKARDTGVSSCTVSLYDRDSLHEIIGASDRGMNHKHTLETIHRSFLWTRLGKELSPRQREVVELTRQGLAPHEIAERLGVSRQAVHIVYNRIVKKAKRHFCVEAA